MAYAATDLAKLWRKCLVQARVDTGMPVSKFDCIARAVEIGLEQGITETGFDHLRHCGVLPPKLVPVTWHQRLRKGLKPESNICLPENPERALSDLLTVHVDTIATQKKGATA